MKRDLVYLSGGITKNPNYKKDFRRAERKMRSAGFDVINPAEIIACIPLKSHEDYMDVALKWLEKADAVLMLCGWSASEGAVQERNHAKLNNIPVFYEDGAERSEK